MSGRISRRPVTKRLEQRRVNLCRDGLARRMQWWSGAGGLRWW
jgi:hypothetical protein